MTRIKLRIVSDLHLDGCSMGPRSEVGARAVLIAGDCCNGRNTPSIPMHLESIFPEQDILIVTGNHEGYRLVDYATMQAGLAAACQGTRVTLLNRSIFDLDGLAILGATLWTDFELFGKQRVEQGKSAAAAAMMDYQCVGIGGRVITPEDTLAWHREDRAWINEQRRRLLAAGRPCAIMTHHAPSRASLALRYAMDLSSAGFVSDLEPEEFSGSKLWVHGHTHTGFDHMVGDCRVVCNPRGYTSDPYISTENPMFNPDFCVEIEY